MVWYVGATCCFTSSFKLVPECQTQPEEQIRVIVIGFAKIRVLGNCGHRRVCMASSCMSMNEAGSWHVFPRHFDHQLCALRNVSDMKLLHCHVTLDGTSLPGLLSCLWVPTACSSIKCACTYCAAKFFYSMLAQPAPLQRRLHQATESGVWAHSGPLRSTASAA